MVTLSPSDGGALAPGGDAIPRRGGKPAAQAMTRCLTGVGLFLAARGCGAAAAGVPLALAPLLH